MGRLMQRSEKQNSDDHSISPQPAADIRSLGNVKPEDRTAAREKRLHTEIAGLHDQLESARKIIRGKATKGISHVYHGENSSLRQEDSGRRTGIAVNRESKLSDNGDSSASLRDTSLLADRLRAELAEERVSREHDRQRFEMQLGELESEKQKLLRQVKFLAQEEEETRAECKEKQEAFLAESTKLQETLRAEREALAEMESERDVVWEETRASFQRKVEREAAAREAAEGLVDTLQRQTAKREAELLEARKARQEAESKTTRMSRELATLQRERTDGSILRESSGNNGVDESSTSWDTQVARELRSQIRTLERATRKHEARVQELLEDQRNAVVLEEKVRSLEAKLQRSENSLRDYLGMEAEYKCMKDERAEWAMIFSRAIREDRGRTKGSEITTLGDSRGVRDKGESDEEEPRPTPLVALRLLRDVQREKSVLVKELAVSKLRFGEVADRLQAAEERLNQHREGANRSKQSLDDAVRELETLNLRCRSAEQEVKAQKELIESYERDNFRKPAKEIWLADHAAMERALMAAKEEAERLRERVGGQLAPATAREFREKIAELEENVESMAKQRDDALRRMEVLESETVAGKNQTTSGALDGGGGFKVLHMINNPVVMTAKARMDALARENRRLLQQLESARPNSLDYSVLADSEAGNGITAKGGGIDASKFSLRLKEAYRERIQYFREVVYLLTGYRIDLLKESTQQVVRLRSMYAEHEEDTLLFQRVEHGLELVETPFATQLRKQIDAYLVQCKSYPAFLSNLTMELFEKQTFVPSS